MAQFSLLLLYRNFKFFHQWIIAFLYLDGARSARSFSWYSCPTLSFQKILHFCTTEKEFCHILSPLSVALCYCLIYGVKGKDFLSSPAQASVLDKSCMLGLLLLVFFHWRVLSPSKIQVIWLHCNFSFITASPPPPSDTFKYHLGFVFVVVLRM